MEIHVLEQGNDRFNPQNKSIGLISKITHNLKHISIFHVNIDFTINNSFKFLLTQLYVFLLYVSITNFIGIKKNLKQVFFFIDPVMSLSRFKQQPQIVLVSMYQDFENKIVLTLPLLCNHLVFNHILLKLSTSQAKQRFSGMEGGLLFFVSVLLGFVWSVTEYFQHT